MYDWLPRLYLCCHHLGQCELRPDPDAQGGTQELPPCDCLEEDLGHVREATAGNTTNKTV